MSKSNSSESDETTETTEVVKEPTQAEKDLAAAVEILKPLAKAGKSEDEMAIALIQNGGFAFKKAVTEHMNDKDIHK